MAGVGLPAALLQPEVAVDAVVTDVAVAADADAAVAVDAVVADVAVAGGAVSDELEESDSIGEAPLASLAELVERAEGADAHTDFKTEAAEATEKLGFRTLWAWAVAMGGCWWFALELFFFLCERVSYVGADTWLSAWTAAGASNQTSAFAAALGQRRVESVADTHGYIGVYCALIGANLVFAFARTGWFVYGGGRAAAALFRRLLHGIVRSPMAFYDTTPVGRLTTRLSFDTEIVDTVLVTKVRPPLSPLSHPPTPISQEPSPNQAFLASHSGGTRLRTWRT